MSVMWMCAAQFIRLATHRERFFSWISMIFIGLAVQHAAYDFGRHFRGAVTRVRRLASRRRRRHSFGADPIVPATSGTREVAVSPALVDVTITGALQAQDGDELPLEQRGPASIVVNVQPTDRHAVMDPPQTANAVTSQPDVALGRGSFLVCVLPIIGTLTIHAFILIVCWAADSWNYLFVFLLVPVGALLRFATSRALDSKALIPVGTLIANVFGTGVMAIVAVSRTRWRSGLSDTTDALLFGVMQGLCGCLTTVSSFVAQLERLPLRHAYLYATLSVGLAQILAISVVAPLNDT